MTENRATPYVANDGQPCRYCGKPYSVTRADIRRLRADLKAEYDGATNEDVAKDVDICAACAGLTSSED